MKRQCKNCRGEFAAKPNDDYLLVEFTARIHTVDFVEGYPSTERFEPVDSGMLCSFECLAAYVNDQLATRTVATK